MQSPKSVPAAQEAQAQAQAKAFAGYQKGLQKFSLSLWQDRFLIGVMGGYGTCSIHSLLCGGS